jgi:hypothetical protein
MWIECLDLANHSGSVKPCLLVTDESVAELEDMEDPKLHRRAASVHAQKGSFYVAGGDALIDHERASTESAHYFKMKVRYGGGDSLVHLGRRRLAMYRAIRVTHVVPDDILGVGSKDAGDVVAVLRCEVAVNDVQGLVPPVGLTSEP